MRFLPYVCIAALAVGLTLPAALRPPMLQDSFWIDWVWLDQFARQLATGDLYPRWLNQSHGGLGSPVFYFYPPLAFYLGSIFVLAGLSTYAGLVAAFAAGFALSGLAMYFYLKGQARRPLLGALLFMAAPYHLLNFHFRGAFAEFLATALVPLVAVGLDRMRQGRGFGFLAVSYAALIMTHLPLALIVTVFFAIPYLLLHRTWWGFLALGLGTGLAACYLAPALLLEPFRDAHSLWMSPLLRPGNWSVWSGGATATPVYFIVANCAVATLLTAVLIRSRWAAYAAVCAILSVGIIPIVWSLPLLRDVQFPYRILPLAEFAIAVAVARSDKSPIRIAVFAAPMLVVSFLLIRVPDRIVTKTWPEVTSAYPDVIENLPPSGPPDSRSDWVSDLAIKAPRGSVFEFPAWQVRCNGMVVLRPTGRVLIDPPALGCERRLVLTPAEWLGWIVSLLSLLALFSYPIFLRRKWRARQESNLRPHA